MFATRTRRILAASTLLAASAGGLLATAQSAQADPTNAKNSLVLTVVCDNGHSYQAVTNGNGHFTPAHDLASTATLVPLSFGEQTFTVTDQNGMVVDQQTLPPSAKGNSADAPNRATQTMCTFSGSQTSPGGFTFSIDGSVLGFVTPAA